MNAFRFFFFFFCQYALHLRLLNLLHLDGLMIGVWILVIVYLFSVFSYDNILRPSINLGSWSHGTYTEFKIIVFSLLAKCCSCIGFVLL